jgi:hypothetical protein
VPGEDHFHPDEPDFIQVNDSAHESAGNVNQIEQLLSVNELINFEMHKFLSVCRRTRGDRRPEEGHGAPDRYLISHDFTCILNLIFVAGAEKKDSNFHFYGKTSTSREKLTTKPTQLAEPKFVPATDTPDKDMKQQTGIY